MTSSPANPRVATGAQASHPPAPGVVAIYRNRLRDFTHPTTELSTGHGSPSPLKCGAYCALLLPPSGLRLRDRNDFASGLGENEKAAKTVKCLTAFALCCPLCQRKVSNVVVSRRRVSERCYLGNFVSLGCTYCVYRYCKNFGTISVLDVQH